MGTGFYQLAKLLGHFPGDKLGFGGREFPGLMRDWCFNARTGHYRPEGDEFDYETALGTVEARVKSLSIDGDWMAPERAVHNLLDKFGPKGSVEHIHLADGKVGRKLDHFSWAREPETILPFIL